jgi:trans-aconitate methyltransferase
MRDLTPLCELAIKHSTDKGGRHNTYNHEACHGTHEYTPVYYDLFSRQRDHVRSVLEIGINRGCSLRMWEEFFPNAAITGLDIDPACLVNEGRIKSFQADQSDPHSLANAIQAAATFPFDIIIDDGSHNMMDQVVTLSALHRLMTPIGIYVIEDIPRADLAWHTYLLKNTPADMRCGLVVPEKGTGTINDDVLYVGHME